MLFRFGAGWKRKIFSHEMKWQPTCGYEISRANLWGNARVLMLQQVRAGVASLIGRKSRTHRRFRVRAVGRRLLRGEQRATEPHGGRREGERAGADRDLGGGH